MYCMNNIAISILKQRSTFSSNPHIQPCTCTYMYMNLVLSLEEVDNTAFIKEVEDKLPFLTTKCNFHLRKKAIL